MWAPKPLFVKQTGPSDWYKKCRTLQGDGLAAIHQPNGPNITALFKSEGLSITTDTDLIETDLINLEIEKLFPDRKPSNTPNIHPPYESNHPPSITKQLPSMTNRVFQICHAMKMNSTRLNILRIFSEKQRI